jgi:hypothetical protein
VLTLFGDSQGIELTFLRAVDFADDLPVEFLPIGDFSIRTGRKQLILFRMEDDLFEEG